MSPFFHPSKTFKVRLAFLTSLLLSLLTVISISGANSPSWGDGSQDEHVDITLHEFEFVVLPQLESESESEGGVAFQGQILALGTECHTLGDLPLTPINETPMSEIAPDLMFYLYEITDGTSIGQIVQDIDDLSLDCKGSPNYLTSLSGNNSSWGSPHTGPGANINFPDPRTELIINTINPSSNLMGEEVTVAMFDSFCQGMSRSHLSNRGFGGMTFQKNYAEPLPSTFRSSTPKLCGHGESVISMLQTVALGTQIKLYRVLDDDGFGTLDRLVEALNDFVMMPNQPLTNTVINLSLGVCGDSPLLKEVLSTIHGKGAVIVAAAGNFAELEEPERPCPLLPEYSQHPPPPQYPAAYPFVIAVAASDSDGNLASYANQANLLAPGGEGDCGTFNAPARAANYDCLAVLNSQSPIFGASYWKGSSFAAALVSGLVAELLQHDSLDILTPSLVKTILECSANSQGLVDGHKALRTYNRHKSTGIPPCVAYP